MFETYELQFFESRGKTKPLVCKLGNITLFTILDFGIGF